MLKQYAINSPQKCKTMLILCHQYVEFMNITAQNNLTFFSGRNYQNVHNSIWNEEQFI